MPLGPLLLGAAVAFAICPVTACAEDTATGRIPVQVWRGGDDGLTLRLDDAIEDAFKASSDFVLSSTSGTNAMKVVIPTNVPARRVGSHLEAHFHVEFKSIDDEVLGVSDGTCWDDALAVCADQILKDAKIVVRTIK
jgi:hypothetical protein